MARKAAPRAGGREPVDTFLAGACVRGRQQVVSRDPAKVTEQRPQPPSGGRTGGAAAESITFVTYGAESEPGKWWPVLWVIVPKKKLLRKVGAFWKIYEKKNKSF
ncbi:Hypothetical protein NTJ_11191 [Nesidiocoris tenuis]|uniref:Uncharacterized protein n=1 Tax=Nesidiocoris tenuis TaxID=355587 RepID=A0ABN7B1S9_9HEMI|nr:Hypothetical protein NTJ_11191 [Nesidiocoris tenuis]